MSVKRYLAKMSWTQIETQEHPNGEFVLWQDYARLKAEVERLRKAGDAMAADLLCSDFPLDVCIELRKAWNAAKEGKQP